MHKHKHILLLNIRPTLLAVNLWWRRINSLDGRKRKVFLYRSTVEVLGIIYGSISCAATACSISCAATACSISCAATACSISCAATDCSISCAATACSISCASVCYKSYVITPTSVQMFITIGRNITGKSLLWSLALISALINNNPKGRLRDSRWYQLLEKKKSLYCCKT